MALTTNPMTYAGCLEALARRFRAGTRTAEALLWGELKGRRLMGYRFERRKQVDRYLVDFYCSELHFALDIVDSHAAAGLTRGADEERTIRLRLTGLRFLTFTEEEVLRNLDGVVSRIRQSVRSVPWRCSR